jgi:hypothetical protein
VFLIQGGYLLFVNPPSWRKPEHYLWNKMTKDNQLIYLKSYSKKEGNHIFGCSTLIDYYLIEKNKKYKNSIIDGQDKKQYIIDLNNWNFLPSGCIDVIEKILGSNEVIYSRTIYGTDKKNILMINKGENKDNYKNKCIENGYIYPIIHNMTKEYGNGIVYSNINKGQIGIKKVVLSFGEYQYPYNDYEGKYGMSQICYGIKINNKEEGCVLVRLNLIFPYISIIYNRYIIYFFLFNSISLFYRSFPYYFYIFNIIFFFSFTLL